MSNVIDFTAVLNARRANAEIALRQAAQADRLEAKVDKIAEAVDKLFGLPLNREVARNALERQEAANAPKFVPAYCDPENEVRGAKHDATRGLDITEIAKRMRADIKALNLDKGFKVAVRTQRYSGGQSIDIRVTAVPEGFRILSDKAASWVKQFPRMEHRAPFPNSDWNSEELNTVMASLKRIHASYNRNNSDSMTDYFDVRYYGGADLDWQISRDCKAREVEAARSDYWADDCA
jgi:hypothetical protein